MDTGGSDLWTEYRSAPTNELRHQLVIQYSPLVKYVAGRVRVNLPPTVESADLVSEGVIGLMDAIEKFDPSRGWEFPTYAVPRIRGAIIDSIRAADWVPRSVRTKLRAIDAARTSLQHSLGRSPEPEEIAAETGMTLAELRQLLEKPTHVANAGDDELAEVDDPGPSMDEAFEDEATRETLKAAVRLLPQRDQIIVALYFFEGFTLAEIGQVLDVTESRVSQLRTRALKALRDELAGSLHA